jgi:serine/threonine protein kinase/WD40 repeat protein
MENLSEQRLKGYELHERIGAGGFGAVYRAYQSTVNREVAIKIILPGVAHQPDFVRRFEMEAQLVARLEHMNIVPLYDYWRDKDGAYLVMRWLRGGNLRDKLEKGACKVEEAARILTQLTSALSTAHRNNVIHRDLKPANILLDEEGNAYLSDFGIAKDNNNVDGSMTDADVIVGSLDYISPEQARSEAVTPRTDIYSLGVVLYEMLVGEHPFPNAKSIERLYKHLNVALPLIQNLPPQIVDRVNDVIQKATAKDPAHRYADALEFANAFVEAARLVAHPISDSVVELLTLREQEVLQFMLNNLSNKEIAAKLVVSVNTVKYFQKQIYAKLRVRNRAQAIARAREINLGEQVRNSVSGITTYLPEPENPYKGLQAFQSADSQHFFGRERLVNKIIQRMTEADSWSRFLAVVGPSGSGKSSVVKAGVIPALWRGELPESDHWFIAEMTPGTHPLEELEIALSQVSVNATTDIMQQLERDDRGLLRAARMILPDDGSELVLVIDQFEEVFTLVESEERRAYFLKLLFNAVADSRSRIRILLTMRADFYDRPLRYADFGEMLRTRMETVLPLSAEELERAIVTPARNEGIQFEEGLAAAIISEVNYQPGALPLLQYALTELFEHREKRLLTHAAYRAIGGTVGALAKRADELYLELDDTGQAIVQQMFMRLVTLGEGTEDTRRRINHSELLAVCSDGDLLEEVIDTYVSYRLLSLDHDPITRSPVVEVAHEAILSVWKRLQTWINDNREEIRMQQQLTRMAEEWQQASQDPSYLASGLRLEQMKAWAQETQLALSPLERQFLQASISDSNQRKQVEQARKAYEAGLEQQSVRRLRLMVATFAIASVLALILSAVALFQRNAAQEQSRIAQQRADDLYSLSLVSAAQDAMSAVDTGLALSLAMESVTGDTSSEESQRLLSILAQQPGPIRSIYEGEFTAWIPSWDYQYVALRKSNGDIDIVDIASGDIVQQLDGQRGAASTLMQFSFDNTLLLEWRHDFRLILWNIQTGEQSQLALSGDRCCPARDGNIMFMPDNHAFLSTTYAGDSAILTDARTGETLRNYSFADEGINFRTIAVSPDGQMAAGGGLYSEANNQRGAILVWNIETGAAIHRFDNIGLTTEAVQLGYFPDGATLWVSSANETVVLDATTGEVLQRLRGRIRQMFVMPASHVITDYQGGTVWDLETGQGVSRLPEVNNFHMLPDGRTVLIEIADKLELWDVNARIGQLQQFEIHDDVAWAVGYSPDGRYALTGGGATLCVAFEGDDNRLLLWDVETGAIQHEMLGHEALILDIAFSPDGRYAVSGSADGVAILWDVTTGHEVRRFAPQIPGVSASFIAFRPDGHTVAISYPRPCVTNEGEVIVWNIDNGEIHHRIPTPFLSTYWILLSSDGQLAAFIEGATVSIVDVTSGEEISNVQSNSPIGDTVFAHDGQTLFVSYDNGQIIQWDVTTGEHMQTLDAHGRVLNVEVSPDGKYLVSASGSHCSRMVSEREFILWDLASGQPVRHWYLPACGYASIDFSPDGQTLMVGSDENIHIYLVENPSTPEWIRANRYIREFTCEERETYRIEPLCGEE